MNKIRRNWDILVCGVILGYTILLSNDLAPNLLAPFAPYVPKAVVAWSLVFIVGLFFVSLATIVVAGGLYLVIWLSKKVPGRSAGADPASSDNPYSSPREQ